MYRSEFDLSGIHIRSRPGVPDEYNLAWTIEITPTVILWMSEVSLNHKILLRTLIFTCVLITSHPLKTFRITENKTQLLYGMKWYIKCAPSLMVQYFSRKDRRPSFHVVNR